VEQLNAMADEVQTFNRGDEAVASGLVDAAKYKDEVLDDLRSITGIEDKKGIPIVSATNYARAIGERENQTIQPE
jgi:protease IV